MTAGSQPSLSKGKESQKQGTLGFSFLINKHETVKLNACRLLLGLKVLHDYTTAVHILKVLLTVLSYERTQVQPATQFLFIYY